MKTTVEKIEETKKAFLVQDKDGRKAWLPKQWVDEDMGVDTEKFNTSAHKFERIQRDREENKSYRDDYHEVGNRVKESEKAAAFRAIIRGSQSEEEIEKLVWFPKSQMRDGKVPGWLIEERKKELLNEIGIRLGPKDECEITFE